MHPLWRHWAEPLRVALQTPGVLVTVVSLSYVGLLLTLAAIWRAWPQARFWFITGALFMLLALGPDLLVLGRNTGILLPYELLFQLPIIKISRAPARYFTLTLLCLAVLAAIGTKALMEWRGAGGGAHGGGALRWMVIVFALGFELLPAPLDAYAPARAPGFFTDGTLEDAGALLEIPNPSNRGMYFATLHGRPVSYGELSRDNPGGPLLKYVREGLWGNDIVEDRSGWGCIYSAFDITHVALYPPPDDAWRVRQGIAERRLGEAALVSDTPLGKLYRLPAMEPGDTCVLVGEGWRGARPFENGTLYRWGEQTPTLGLVRRAAGVTRLHFTAHSFAILRQLELRVDGRVAGHFEVSGTPQHYVIDLELPAGTTWIELHSVQPPTSPAEYGYEESDPIAIGYSGLWAEER
jgi:hypothetical protein